MHCISVASEVKTEHNISVFTQHSSSSFFNRMYIRPVLSFHRAAVTDQMHHFSFLCIIKLFFNYFYLLNRAYTSTYFLHAKLDYDGLFFAKK